MDCSLLHLKCFARLLIKNLPAKKKPDLYTTPDEDIKKLLNHIEGKELETAVLLAAFGPLRRGEICALTSDDIKGN
jgi:integrase